ncbi:hypothetical protein [Caminibacter pacificus]
MSNQLFLTKELINLSMFYYNDYSKDSNNRFIPSFIHPVTCAGMALEDNKKIDLTDRFIVSKALLFHDIPKKTTISIKRLHNDMIDIFNKHYDNHLKSKIGEKTIVINKILELIFLSNKISDDNFRKIKNYENMPELFWYMKMIDLYQYVISNKESLRQNGELDSYLKLLSYILYQISSSVFKISSWFINAKHLLKKHSISFS